MTVFRKVSVKEREPETDKVVIGLWDSDEKASRAVILGENGYYAEAYEGYECDAPDWWLEEVPVPSIDEINAEADRQFAHGRSAEADGFKTGGQWMYNRISRKLLGYEN